MIEILTSPELIVAFFTLTALELVLGIDNIIFISILVDKLPPEGRAFARRLGLFLAMFMRLGLLAALSFLAGMTKPLFALPLLDHGISGRDLILILGGLFLVWKSVGEVHQLMEGEEGEASSTVKATFAAVIFQIIMIDLVFSLDSIITADRKSTRLNSSHHSILYAVFCLKKKKTPYNRYTYQRSIRPACPPLR